MITYQSLLNEGIEKLSTTSPTPKADTELLLKHASNKELAWLIAHAADQVEPDILDTFHSLLEKRLQGEPVAYLIGSRDFWTLNLYVTPDVLIPRPDTETVVEQALKLITGYHLSSIIDLGTGSGAIALSLAKEHPELGIIATDKSSNALQVAKQNAEHNNINNVQFIESSWLNAFTDQSFDLIVSNPPYVAKGDKHLTKGDLPFEPVTALTSGKDGLDDIRTICAQATEHLTNNGYLLLEHGYDQQQAVQEIFKQNGFNDVQTIQDLNQLPRATFGKRHS